MKNNSLTISSNKDTESLNKIQISFTVLLPSKQSVQLVNIHKWLLHISGEFFSKFWYKKCGGWFIRGSVWKICLSTIN